jgi:hypothetical protein
MGFDLDCCCIGYDGKEVWALPRARRAIGTRMNLVDVGRQSTTYEIRLFKYAKRGFRVGVPGFDRKKIKNQDLAFNIGGRQGGPYYWRRNRHKYEQQHFVRESRFTGRNFRVRHGLARLILLEKSLGLGERDSIMSLGLTKSNFPNSLNQVELEVKNSDPKKEWQKFVIVFPNVNHISG